MSERLTRLLTELRRRLDKRYGQRLVRLILFGSNARGDEDPGSDIDVLVVLKGSVQPGKEISRTIHDVAELSLQHNVVFSCVFISAHRFESEQSPLLINVRREGIPI